MRDLSIFDKEMLREIAQEVAEETEALIRVTKSVLALKGEDKISLDTANEIVKLTKERKPIESMLSPPSGLFISASLRRKSDFCEIFDIISQTTHTAIGWVKPLLKADPYSMVDMHYTPLCQIVSRKICANNYIFEASNISSGAYSSQGEIEGCKYG